MAVLHTVVGRSKLAAQREPYWLRLGNGQHLGYRNASSGPGSWVAKLRDPDSGSRSIHAPGDVAHLSVYLNRQSSVSIKAPTFRMTAGLSGLERQFALGLVQTAEGLPIAYEIFKGNVAEVSTLLPMVERVLERFDIKRAVLVADRRLLSVDNLEALRKTRLSGDRAPGDQSR